MDINAQISTYISQQDTAKRDNMKILHDTIIGINPLCKLWFLDGKNSENKVVSNPNIGYGAYQIKYKDGKTKEFYQIGMSANTSGISIYIFGIEDKKFLSENFGKKIGKASVTGYCIKFKSLKDIHITTLIEAIKVGFNGVVTIGKK
ncbi:MAG TPA: DUF1801 domain-containing protein [Bacteroidia bacterium]|nr:DUF1801 domain-containing protein [Bacteroidia bacterium]